jgi:multicomponent Na+:H+ antiporter subunit E
MRHRQRRGFQWPIMLGLTAVWVLLWGNLSVANVVSGAVLSSLVVVVFPLPPIHFSGRFHPIGIAHLIGRFMVDLVVASAQIAATVLRPGSQPLNAVIEVDLRSRSDLYLTLTAELLSLIPGSLVIEARRSTGTLYLHVLGVRDASDVERSRAQALAQEERVVRALASREELEAYDIARGGAR